MRYSPALALSLLACGTAHAQFLAQRGLLAPNIQALMHNMATGGDAPVLTIGGTQNVYTLPGQNMDPYIQPHALMLGAQRAGSGTSATATDLLGTGSSIVLRGMPDGYMDMGCLICSVMTPQSVFQARAGISGNLTDPSNIANDPSYDSVVDYEQPGSTEPEIVLTGVTYDATHIYLPSGSYLTPQQIARIHPNQYIATNSITSDVAAPTYPTDSGLQNPTSGTSLAPHNYYVSLVSSVASDGSSITVQGWGIHNGNSTGHAWRSGDVPGTTYDTVRSNFGQAVAMIGAPTQAGGRNIFMSFDPTNNPHSLVDYFNADEIDIHYGGTASNQATMRGLVISMDCQGPAQGSGKCLHPTYDSTGLIINGLNLPNGIQNTVAGWANEYKGYNYYIPGSEAPAVGQGNAHTSYESMTPSADGHQLVTRSWVQQYDSAASPTWTDYRVNLGLVIDGTRWDSSAKTGSNMGYLSFDYSAANLGGICLVGNNTASLNADIPGLCVRGDGSAWIGDALNLQSGKPIEAHTSSGGAGATLYGDNNGDWQIGTQVSGGGNLRGVNGYYGSSASITGTATLGVMIAQWLETQASGAITMHEGSIVKWETASNATTTTIQGDDNGDLTLGTQVSGGANLRGVNGVYAASATLSGLSGSGNAYACLDSSGHLYRSATACN